MMGLCNTEACELPEPSSNEIWDSKPAAKVESQQTGFYKGQNDTDWTEKTPLDLFLESKADSEQWLRNNLQMYENGEISYCGRLNQVPESKNWIRGVLPQFRTFSHRDCLLFLGFCPQYAGVTPGEGIASLDPKQQVPFTELFLGAAARALNTDAIDLCVRKECRKSREQAKRTYSDCRPISASEAVGLFLATKLEIAIAKKEFGIRFTTCLACSNIAQEIARLLPLPDFPIMDLSHLTIIVDGVYVNAMDASL